MAEANISCFLVNVVLLFSTQEEIWKQQKKLLLALISAGDILSGKLKDLLAQKENVVIQVESDCIVAAAARKMRDNKVGALMVMENGSLSGIFTESDLMSRVVAEGLDPEKVQVSEAMSSSIATVPLEHTYP